VSFHKLQLIIALEIQLLHSHNRPTSAEIQNHPLMQQTPFSF